MDLSAEPKAIKASFSRQACNMKKITENNFFPLPSPSRPWFLIPTDDAGVFRYFVLHVLSSKERHRQYLIRCMRIFVRLGGHHLWPIIAPSMLKIIMRG